MGESGGRWVWATLAVTPLFFFIPLTHDAGWQIWIGRQMAHGANLYTDIVEVNPPLWFWIATPLAYLAEASGLPSLSIIVSFFIVSIAFSIWLITKISRRNSSLWLVVAMLFPLQHFAQREHFTLLAAIPYVMLIARRERCETVPTSTAILVGGFAAFGFALKPLFAAVPLLLELWAWRTPKVRPETITMGIAAALYILALALFEQDYLTMTLPLVATAYGQFGEVKLGAIAGSLLPFFFAGPLLLRARGEAAAYTIAALTFYLLYLLQLKGWYYQALPALGMLLVAVGVTRTGSIVRKSLVVAVAILIIVPNLKPYETPREFRLALPRGTSFAALSISPRAAWPMVENRGLKWPLRYLSMWMAPAAKPDILHDLLCNPPDFLLIDDQKVNFSSQVAPILSSYAMIQENGGIHIYRRTATLSKATGCRTIH